MSNQWLRWYRGTVEDAKFRHIARQAKVNISDVIAVWAVLLEDAASYQHRGVVTRDEDWIATILDFEDGMAEQILESMQAVGMVSIGHGAITICNWGARQFESDIDKTAAERKKRQRERQSQAGHNDVTRDTTVSHASVTAPDTDTDTDTKKEKRVVAAQERSPTKRATRWGASDPVPPEWLAEANQIRTKANLSPVDPALEAARFVDFWAAKSGKDATKADWHATWRNWIRNSRGGAAPNGSARIPMGPA